MFGREKGLAGWRGETIMKTQQLERATWCSVLLAGLATNISLSRQLQESVGAGVRDTITATELVIVDKEGRERCVVGQNWRSRAFGMFLYNEVGEEIASFAGWPGGETKLYISESGKGAAHLGVGSSRGPELLIFNGSGLAVVKAGAKVGESNNLTSDTSVGSGRIVIQSGDGKELFAK